MKILCGWCQCFIWRDLTVDDGIIKHGICPDCAEKLREELREMRRKHEWKLKAVKTANGDRLILTKKCAVSSKPKSR
jgi:hypothetical protein